MPPAKTPNEPVEPLHEVLKSLVALQEHAAASQEQMRESSEALIEANRTTLEVLTQRLIDATQRSAHELSEAMLKSRTEQLAVVVQPPAEDATTRQQRLRQQQLVLTYNALRTMLGRTPGVGSTGAAVVFMADRVDGSGKHDPGGDSIKILPRAPFRAVEDGWKLWVITTRGQTLHAPMHRDKDRVQVDNLGANLDVARLEIRDHDDNPLYLGVGPATQTHNARKHKRRQIAEGGTTDEDPDEAPRVSYDDGISAPTPELDPGIR